MLPVHFGMLMGGMVVEDDMNRLVSRADFYLVDILDRTPGFQRARPTLTRVVGIATQRVVAIVS
jgi:hypothetical protein